MRQYLKIKPRVKKPKPVAIESYKVSYLDKRSKSYHRIVMTSFAGLFGFVGVLYVFSSSASTDGSNGGNNPLADNLPLVFAIVLAVFLVVLIVFLYLRKK
jgi:hypothetical protein